jgi:hypothetical protein
MLAGGRGVAEHEVAAAEGVLDEGDAAARRDQAGRDLVHAGADHGALGGGVVQREQVGGAQQPLDLVGVLGELAGELTLGREGGGLFAGGDAGGDAVGGGDEGRRAARRG